MGEGNPRFFMHDGMLCRRTASGASVVVFTNACARIAFPETVVAVEDYAFNNAFGIEELSLDADNINGVIDAVNCLHDASTTGCLLELKRLRFGYGAADYGI